MTTERRQSEKRCMQEFFQAVRHPQASLTYEEFVEFFTNVLRASHASMVVRQQRKASRRQKLP
jgi:hypothetical protein